jgi:hypothetical protein
VADDGTSGGIPPLQPPPARVDNPVVRIRAVAVALVALASGGALALGPANGRPFVDHAVYLRTVSAMRGGAAYYPAMDGALRDVIGPAGTVRAFRLPTVFWAWAQLPGRTWIWVGFVAVCALTGLLAVRLGRHALAGPLVTVALLAAGFGLPLPGRGGRVDQWTLVEIWVAPLVVGTALAWSRRRDGLAALLAAAAFCVRETTGLLLVGGLLAAWRTGRRRTPWIVGLLAAGAVTLLHAHAAGPFLAGPGSGAETPLLGTGRPWFVPTMTGAGLPLGVVLGPVLWVAAVAHARHGPGHEDRAVGALHLWLPLLGLVLRRDYWGLLVLPLVLVWGVDEIAARVEAWRAPRRTSRRPAVAGLAAPEPAQ